MENMTFTAPSTKNLVQKLQEAAKEPTFNAICHLFAMRERARRVITVQAYHDSLNEEGFKADKEAVGKVFETLANLGLGKLDHHANGRIRSLKDISIQLQSIGKAALGSDPMLKRTKTKPRLKPLILPNQQMPQKVITARKQIKNPFRASAKMTVTVQLGERKVSFDIPAVLLENDFASNLEKELKK